MFLWGCDLGMLATAVPHSSRQDPNIWRGFTGVSGIATAVPPSPSQCLYMSHCQNSSKFLSIAYFMETADVIMFFLSSHDRTNHTC